MPEADDDRHTGEVTFFPATAASMDLVVAAVGIDGAAVAILTDTAAARDLLHATSDTAVRIDELQFTVGEGPCLDAFRSGAPVAIADLADDSRTHRWPTFAADVVGELGVHALLACPITAGGAALGVLELYRRAPGVFTGAQFDAAISAAAALGTTVLAELQIYDGDLDKSGYSPPQGSFRFARADVNVAIGILSVRLGVSIDNAAAILRAHAYTRSRSVSSIAHDIAEGREAFDLGD